VSTLSDSDEGESDASENSDSSANDEFPSVDDKTYAEALSYLREHNVTLHRHPDDAEAQVKHYSTGFLRVEATTASDDVSWHITEPLTWVIKLFKGMPHDLLRSLSVQEMFPRKHHSVRPFGILSGGGEDQILRFQTPFEAFLETLPEFRAIVQQEIEQAAIRAAKARGPPPEPVGPRTIRSTIKWYWTEGRQEGGAIVASQFTIGGFVCGDVREVAVLIQEFITTLDEDDPLKCDIDMEVYDVHGSRCAVGFAQRHPSEQRLVSWTQVAGRYAAGGTDADAYATGRKRGSDLDLEGIRKRVDVRLRLEANADALLDALNSDTRVTRKLVRGSSVQGVRSNLKVPTLAYEFEVKGVQSRWCDCPGPSKRDFTDVQRKMLVKFDILTGKATQSCYANFDGEWADGLIPSKRHSFTHDQTLFAPLLKAKEVDLKGLLEAGDACQR
jgi:hypothetical protein